LLDAFFVHELIGAQVSLAGAAINHRIGETFDMAGCLENSRMREDRAVHSDYIIALVHHDAPPVVLQITL
jgi:hypothetical protein